MRVRCLAAWLDVAPELVGRKRLLSWSSYGSIRNRGIPIWLDEELFAEVAELEPLEEANWQRFAFGLPGELPRALEGTFVAFRWMVEARRRRLIGGDVATLPLLIDEPQTLPVVRVERLRSAPGACSSGGRNRRRRLRRILLGELRAPPGEDMPLRGRDA